MVNCGNSKKLILIVDVGSGPNRRSRELYCNAYTRKRGDPLLDDSYGLKQHCYTISIISTY